MSSLRLNTWHSPAFRKMVQRSSHTVKVRIPADDDLGGCIASRSAVRNPACAEVDKLSLSCGVVEALAFSKVKCGADVFEGQPEKKSD